MRLLILIFTFFIALFTPHFATAQSTIEMELSNQGFADATVTVMVRPLGRSSIGSALLPFRLSEEATIRTADTISASILAMGDDYTLIAFLHPENTSQVKLRILNAVEIIPTGSKRRVRFSFDFGFSGFQQHSTILAQASETVKNFDLSVRLPAGVTEDDIAFAPRVGWTTALPLVTLPSSAGNGLEVYVAFSNPMTDSRWFAQVVLGGLAGLVTILIGGRLFSPRKLKIRALVSIAVLAAGGIALVIYFLNTLIEPLNFLAWVIGIAGTWPLLVIVCTYVALRKLTDAEVVGSVQILGEHGTTPARFVNIEVTDASRPGWRLVETVDDSGEYQIFVFCGKSSRELQLSVTNHEFNEVKSDIFNVGKGDRRQMDPIALTRKGQNDAETVSG